MMGKFSQLVVDSFVGMTYEGAAMMDEPYMGFEPDALLSIVDVVNVLAENGIDIHRQTIRRMIEREEIEAKKIGNAWIIEANQLPIVLDNIRPPHRPPKDSE